MADQNRTTLLVAVAGIAATALVGLAATTAGWLSARDDRATQRALARDERTYDRRVSVYLDAIDFVEGQRRRFLPFFGGSFGPAKVVPHRVDPPTRLIARLRAFGSAQVFEEFQKTNAETVAFLHNASPVLRDTGYGLVDPASQRAFDAFNAQVIRFELVVHDEVG